MRSIHSFAPDRSNRRVYATAFPAFGEPQDLELPSGGRSSPFQSHRSTPKAGIQQNRDQSSRPQQKNLAGGKILPEAEEKRKIFHPHQSGETESLHIPFRLPISSELDGPGPLTRGKHLLNFISIAFFPTVIPGHPTNCAQRGKLSVTIPKLASLAVRSKTVHLSINSLILAGTAKGKGGFRKANYNSQGALRALRASRARGRAVVRKEAEHPRAPLRLPERGPLTGRDLRWAGRRRQRRRGSRGGWWGCERSRTWMTRLLPAQLCVRCRGPVGDWLLGGEYAAAVGRRRHGARAGTGGGDMGRQWQRRRLEEAGADEPAAAGVPGVL